MLLERAALGAAATTSRSPRDGLPHPGARLARRPRSTGTFASLISDIASQVEDILADEFNGRGYDPKLAPMYAQMLVGMVALTGQWWLDVRKPDGRRWPPTWSTWPGTA